MLNNLLPKNLATAKAKSSANSTGNSPANSTRKSTGKSTGKNPRHLLPASAYSAPLAASFLMTALATLLMTGCTPTPPDYRAQVTAPVYEGGDPENGQLLYEEHCEQCHKLTAGSNKKGPQLLGVYMAPSAELEDYNYSDVMDNANWTWDADTLDTYIADAEVALPDTRMLSDPLPNAQHRQDIIAYLSTLGRDAPPQPEQP